MCITIYIYIYGETKIVTQINDKSKNSANAIFGAVVAQSMTWQGWQRVSHAGPEPNVPSASTFPTITACRHEDSSKNKKEMVITHNKQSKAIDNLFSIMATDCHTYIIWCTVKILSIATLANNTLCNWKQQHKQHVM